MNGTAAKASRRNLRRLIGSQAVQAVDSHERAFRLVQQDILTEVNARKDADSELRRELDSAKLSLRQAHGLITAETDDRRAFTSRSFWHRLRWIVTGR